jgi:cyclopropane-fatty-acyl-phospholipid synthase
MNTNTTTIGAKGASPAHRKDAPLPARLALRFLERLDSGRLHVELPSGARLAYGPGGTEAEIVFHDWRAFGRILRDGDIGFAEGFLDQQWHTPDLTALLGLLAANRAALDAPLYGSLAGRLMHRLMHALRSNTRSGSRRNIAAHYDLGNDFYSLWLDPGMTYSSALFESEGQSLADAQSAKYRRILDRIAPAPEARILEIGCGWGGFAELAASEKCHVTGLTLSREQLEFARARLASGGHADRTAIGFRDYRDETGTYDAVVSIEMIEAVGERWWPDYFGKVASSLRPGGKAVIQAIVIADELFERYRKGSDFIQQYIFPGGMLASPARFRALAAQAGLGIEDEFSFGMDYWRTLAAWREQFLARADAVRALGFDERFMRMWEFYFAYCQAGFSSGSTDVMHFTLVKR